VATPPRSRGRAAPRGLDPRPSRGRAAEAAAAELLVRAGFRIVARNVRLAGAEIDLVAEEGEEIVFVEVRSRSDSRHGGPLATVGRVKQERIARAAAAFLARVERSSSPARFDVIGVEWRAGRAACTHVRSAFESPW
jgi:putative endonuclease